MKDHEKDPYLSEEYQFLEEPELDNTTEKNTAEEPIDQPKSHFDMAKVSEFFKQNSPARNVLILVAAILVLFMLYKFVSGMFSNTESKQLLTKQKQPVQTVQVIQPTQIEMPKQNASEETNQIKAKLAALDSKTSNMQTQFSALSNQVSSLNANVNALVTKIDQLNQQMTSLSSTVQEQSNTIMLLRERARPPAPRVQVRRVAPNPMPGIRYYVEAVIPGRAWLIATNGSTLTVRVGSVIPGYGMVKAIDAIQGRVLMSSGQVIRFSQNDS